METETGNERWNKTENTEHTHNLQPQSRKRKQTLHGNTINKQGSAKVPSTFLNRFVNVLERTSFLYLSTLLLGTHIQKYHINAKKENEQTSEQQQITQRKQEQTGKRDGERASIDIETTRHTQVVTITHKQTLDRNTINERESPEDPSTFLNNFVNVLERRSF